MTNWDAYFAMPNENNKERLFHYIDEEITGMQGFAENFIINNYNNGTAYKEALLLSREIVTSIPEKYLCNAYINYNHGTKLLIFSKSGNDDELYDLCLEISTSHLLENTVKILVWEAMPSNVPRVNSIRFVAEYGYGEDSLDVFVGKLIKLIDSIYGK